MLPAPLRRSHPNPIGEGPAVPLALTRMTLEKLGDPGDVHWFSKRGASMKRLLLPAALGLAALAITSCATTNLVQVWRDPSYSPTPVKRVFVVAVIPYAPDRLVFENAIAESLEHGDLLHQTGPACGSGKGAQFEVVLQPAQEL